MKYEEQLKNKLEQRNIQPSSEAWQKLSDKLDANNSKKNNKGFWYLGIAASIVGILLITNVFNNTNTDIVEPIIVDTKNDLESSKEKAPDTIIIDKEETQQSKPEEKAEAVKNSNPVKKDGLKQKLKKEQLKLIPNKVEETVIAVNPEEKHQEPEVKKLTLEEQKAQEVVAQIQTMQQIKEVTDAEIEALLNTAQKEIIQKRLYDESTKRVDANALLLSVEDAIEEQSFRTRVFEMLKSGYKEVKTVVAERNN